MQPAAAVSTSYEVSFKTHGTEIVKKIQKWHAQGNKKEIAKAAVELARHHLSYKGPTALEGAPGQFGMALSAADMACQQDPTNSEAQSLFASLKKQVVPIALRNGHMKVSADGKYLEKVEETKEEQSKPQPRTGAVRQAATVAVSSESAAASRGVVPSGVGSKSAVPSAKLGAGAKPEDSTIHRVVTVPGTAPTGRSRAQAISQAMAVRAT